LRPAASRGSPLLHDQVALDCEPDRGFDVGGDQRTDRLSAGSDDHIETTSRQLAREVLQTIQAALRPPIINRDIATLNQPFFCQAALELLNLAGVQRR
jgi:hypothetical protein